MTTNHSQGAQKKTPPKSSPKGKAGARTSAKRFMMPTVDLGGLGGDDVVDDLPPLDLAAFTSKAPAAAASEPTPVPTAPAEDTSPPTATAHIPSPSPEDSRTTAGNSADVAQNEALTDSQVAFSSGSLGPSPESDDGGEASPARSQQPSSTPAAAAVSTAERSAVHTSQDTGWERSTTPTPDEFPTASSSSPVAAGASPAVWNAAAGAPQTRPWSPAPSDSTLPARRPRRAPSRAFTPSQNHSRREERLKELLTKAPCYAALLESYAIAQSGKETYQNRNIQLYGLTAQELADRITVDKAVMTAMNLPTPRFTPAHYIDAVLERALQGLNPQGTDLGALETDRDIVWELAQDGLAYRDFISTDPAIAALKKPRSQCPLRIRVNQRVSRMMDILKTMPDLKTQPFEIISACMAKYLQALQTEQPAFEEFWSRNLETSYE
ncbi:hypothetical protein ACFV2N_47040 [Streptomyces sp. NPDC059680]|uniref:hypothetical protein n=1 Tax=Streptomyces sp. NPDC059680 TaxID=3346904 RepID=UPI0036C5850E